MAEKKEKKKKLPPGVRERNGRYTYRYSVEVVRNGKKGRKQKETESYPTPQEAYEAGILIKADKLKGKLVDAKNLTLGQWGDRWLEDYELEREARKKTLYSRMTALNSLKLYFGENTRLKDITSDDYQRYLNNLKKKGRKKNTINSYHSTANLMFADAVRKKKIAESPTAEAVVPVFKKTMEEIELGEINLPKFLEKEQLKKFLQLIRFRGLPQDYVIFLTLAYTGLRIGELLALKVTDFDEKERVLNINKTLSVIDSLKKYSVGPPKNNSSIRKVSIGETVIKVLKAQLDWREQKIKDKETVHDADFIFWSPTFPGYPDRPDRLDRRFKRLLKLSDLPENLTPHSLRHTHVSLLAEAGEQLAVIQERLGHKNDQITRLIYLHITEGQRKAVPDRFDQVMRG
jgi:integrase